MHFVRYHPLQFSCVRQPLQHFLHRVQVWDAVLRQPPFRDTRSRIHCARMLREIVHHKRNNLRFEVLAADSRWFGQWTPPDSCGKAIESPQAVQKFVPEKWNWMMFHSAFRRAVGSTFTRLLQPHPWKVARSTERRTTCLRGGNQAGRVRHFAPRKTRRDSSGDRL